MTIVDTTKFGIGIAFVLVGAVLLWSARGGRGFNQKKQAGALALLAGAVFLAIGLGYLDL